jgi:D-sedoheptulose 7-phosphate isomerase
MTELADDAIAVSAPATATVQEVHQVAVHLVCAAVDLRSAPTTRRARRTSRTRRSAREPRRRR